MPANRNSGDAVSVAPEAGGLDEYVLISVDVSTALSLKEAGETGVVLVINSSCSRVFVAPLSDWGPLNISLIYMHDIASVCASVPPESV